MVSQNIATAPEKIERSIQPSYIPWAASFFMSLGKDANIVSPNELILEIKKQLADLHAYYFSENEEHDHVT